MIVRSYLTVVVMLVIVFFIGLNIGIHGYFVLFHQNPHPPTAGGTRGEVVTGSEGRSTVAPAGTDGVNADRLYNKSDAIIAPISIQPTPVESKLAIVEVLVHRFIKDNMNVLSSHSPSNVSPHHYSSARIPILLLTCNRPSQLRSTLESLLQVRKVERDNIIISQDGAMQEIADIANQYGLKLLQNKRDIHLRGGAAHDGANRIAQHYKYSLSAVFNDDHHYDAVVIVEDDLLLSPDFYEYLLAVYPILLSDPSAFIVSAWSDNGFKATVNSNDSFALRRTDYFPGLGWLLTRSLYKKELESNWPESHWDHWLRSAEVSRQRAIVYPHVPRSFHNGVRGTFMNQETHNKYFRDIAYNRDAAVSWDGRVGLLQREQVPPDALYLSAHSLVYDYRLQQLVEACTHISSVSDLVKYKNELLCVWILVDTDCEVKPVQFEPVAAFFGLWHEHRRGNYHGLHEFSFTGGNYVLLFNVFQGHRHRHISHGSKHSLVKSYRDLMPRGVEPIRDPWAFDRSLLLRAKQTGSLEEQPIAAARRGVSCDEVCSDVAGRKCSIDKTRLLNSCEVMRQYFSCHTCEMSEGLEQPAFVSADAATALRPGVCLVNSRPELTECGASHPWTVRLCVCE